MQRNTLISLLLGGTVIALVLSTRRSTPQTASQPAQAPRQGLPSRDPTPPPPITTQPSGQPPGQPAPEPAQPAPTQPPPPDVTSNSIGCNPYSFALPPSAIEQAQFLLTLVPRDSDARKVGTHDSVATMRTLATALAFCGSATGVSFEIRDDYVNRLRAHATYIETNIPPRR